MIMRKMLISVLVLFCATLVLGGTISKNTGIVLTDTEGRTYDIDNLLDQGKHIGVVTTGSGWGGCIGAGRAINNTYNNDGKNEGDFIFLLLDVQEGDTEKKIKDAYDWLSEEPECPIVLREGGSVTFTKELWFAPYARGPVFFICPDREFIRLNSDGYKYDVEFANAIANDDCEKVSIIKELSDAESNNLFTIEGKYLAVTDVESGTMGLSVFTVQGQKVAAFENLIVRNNTVSIQLDQLFPSMGLYIISTTINGKSRYQKIRFQ